MPSAADIVFLALLAVLIFSPLSVRLLGDAGIGWHIRTGQQILATHSIPRVDPFSSTMVGRPWFAWEWLYDLPVGQLEARMGLNGVVWFTAVVIAAVFAVMFRLLVIRGANLLVALIFVLLAVSASTIHFLARPHVLSWLFTLIWFWILDSSEQECSGERGGHAQRRLWLLPALTLLWVNVHGGFLLGFALLGIFWLAAVWECTHIPPDRIEEALRRIAARKRAAQLLWVGLLSAAASLVNPYGWKLHAHIYSYVSDRFLMDHIEEFQSPNFHGIAQKCFLALLLVAIAALVARGRELPLSHSLTALLAVGSGLYASRNIPASSILLAMVAAPLVGKSLDRQFLTRMTVVDSGLRGHVSPILAAILTFCIAANGGRVGSSRVMDAHFDPRRMPVAAVDFLDRIINPRQGPVDQRANVDLVVVQGPILSPDYWGGYLIYRLSPKMRVVVDDRHDFYGAEFFKSYLKLVHGEPGWEDFLQQHPTGCVLAPTASTLATILIQSGRWRAIYGDEVATIFVPDHALR